MPEPLLNEAAFPSSSIRAVRWPEYGDLLVRAGKLTPRDLERALAAQREMGGALDGVLVSLGLVSESDAAHALAEHLQLPFVQGEAFADVVPELEGLLPEFLRTHRVLPLRAEDGHLQYYRKHPEQGYCRLVIAPKLAKFRDKFKSLVRSEVA